MSKRLMDIVIACVGLLSKRLMDIVIACVGLLMAAPVLLPVLLLVWFQDLHSPFYIAPRVGKNGKIFKMIKVRSMVVRADRTGVDSTAANDARITAIGRLVRRFKLDEVTQLWNVLKGEMSLVGPRPNVERDVALYTEVERKLLGMRPGITDLASIVFADEGEILRGRPDPDLSYNQLIRPWKSHLGLLYVENASPLLDLQLILLTAVTLLSRQRALEGIQKILDRLTDNKELKQIARREEELRPSPPPGSYEVVWSR